MIKVSTTTKANGPIEKANPTKTKQQIEKKIVAVLRKIICPARIFAFLDNVKHSKMTEHTDKSNREHSKNTNRISISLIIME